MKHFQFFTILVVTTFSISRCTPLQDDLSETNILNVNSTEMVEVSGMLFKKSTLEAAQHIRLENNRYRWDIRDKDALRLGLSQEEILKFKAELEMVNAQITQWEENGTPFTLTDPTHRLSLRIK